MPSPNTLQALISFTRNYAVDTNLARAAIKKATPTLALLVIYTPTKLPKTKLNKEVIQ